MATSPDLRKSVIVVAENGRAFQATAGRRWGSRLTDAIIEIAPGTAFFAIEAGKVLPDWVMAFIEFWLVWVIMTAVIGGLYGRGYSPGQLLFSTKTRRERDGRVIGAWRGFCRHFAFTILPIMIAAMFDNPPLAWDDGVMCTDRDVHPAHPHLAEPGHGPFPQS